VHTTLISVAILSTVRRQLLLKKATKATQKILLSSKFFGANRSHLC